LDQSDKSALQLDQLDQESMEDMNSMADSLEQNHDENFRDSVRQDPIIATTRFRSVESVVPSARNGSIVNSIKAPSRRQSIMESLGIPELIESGQELPNLQIDKPSKADVFYNAPSESSGSNAKAMRIGKQYRLKVIKRIA
jgi:hypothetical protein